MFLIKKILAETPTSDVTPDENATNGGISVFNSLKSTIEYTEAPVSGFSNFETATDIVNTAANVMIGIGFGISLATAAFAMVQFITSYGEKENLNKAKNALTWSVGSMIISLLAVSLKIIFFKLLGVKSGY